jgi:hypothetical protein
MMMTCRKCGKAFPTPAESGQLFCSVGCQITVDSIDNEYVWYSIRRSRPARTGGRRGKESSSRNRARENSSTEGEE